MCSTSRASHLLSTSQKILHPVSLLGLMAKIKCSICSYQFNIWYAGHRPAHILIWFLAFGQGSGVHLTLTTGCLGIALQSSAAHIFSQGIKKKVWPRENGHYDSWLMTYFIKSRNRGWIMYRRKDETGICSELSFSNFYNSGFQQPDHANIINWDTREKRK